MDKIIALCISVVLTIGLVSYAIVSAQRQYSYTSDSIGTYNADVNMRLKGSNIVRRDEVIKCVENCKIAKYNVSYLKSEEFKRQILFKDNSPFFVVHKKAIIDDLNSLPTNAMFEVTKEIGEYGNIHKYTFKYIEN